MGKFSPLPRSHTRDLDHVSPARSLNWEPELCCLVASEEHGSTVTRAAGTDAVIVQERVTPHRGHHLGAGWYWYYLGLELEPPIFVAYP